MSASNWSHLDVTKVIHATDKAILVELDDGERVWLPFSQMADPDDYNVGDTDCTISVSEWFARQKRWLDD